MNDPLRVTITGATGQVAYPLIFSIAKGEAFGDDQPITLTLLDLLPKQRVLEGIVMELDDCAFPLLRSATYTDDMTSAFRDAEVVVLLGSLSKRPGLPTEELLLMNGKIFKAQAEVLDKYASRNVKVLVVANPCCSNGWICTKYAPSIPKENFTVLTRHDQFRAECQLASKLNVPRKNIKNVVVWGNHSRTQLPDASRATVRIHNQEMSVEEALKDDVWLHKTFIETNHELRLPQQGKLASALTVAKTIVDHLRNWFLGTPPGQYTSMAVYSDGSYDTPEGVMFSFPVTIEKGKWKIVQDWHLDDFAKKWLKISGDELIKQKIMVTHHMEEECCTKSF